MILAVKNITAFLIIDKLRHVCSVPAATPLLTWASHTQNGLHPLTNKVFALADHKARTTYGCA